MTGEESLSPGLGYAGADGAADPALYVEAAVLGVQGGVRIRILSGTQGIRESLLILSRAIQQATVSLASFGMGGSKVSIPRK